jgi:hypothetical protein
LYLQVRVDLRGFAIVTLHDPSEFGLATNGAVGIRKEVIVQNSIVSTNTAMGAWLVMMFQPRAKDVVELSSTEADEMVQRFSLRTSDIVLDERVRHRGAWWNSDRPLHGAAE